MTTIPLDKKRGYIMGIKNPSNDEFLIEQHFPTAKEFINALMPWSESFDLSGYIFRGQSDASYQLRPTSLRDGAKSKITERMLAFMRVDSTLEKDAYFQAFAEYQLIRDFYRIADLRGLPVPASVFLRANLHRSIDIHTMAKWVDGHNWLPTEMLEAAGLAQHYGIPTRLLDWTYDPLTAAYFASKPSATNVDGNLCIWAFNSDQIGFLAEHDAGFPLKFITPHYHGNPNLGAQRGLFTHWATGLRGVNRFIHEGMTEANVLIEDPRPLNELIYNYIKSKSEVAPKKIFIKLTLPCSESVTLAQHLRKLQYGPAQLFPGYHGVFEEIEERTDLHRAKRSEKYNQPMDNL